MIHYSSVLCKLRSDAPEFPRRRAGPAEHREMKTEHQRPALSADYTFEI